MTRDAIFMTINRKLNQGECILLTKLFGVSNLNLLKTQLAHLIGILRAHDCFPILIALEQSSKMKIIQIKTAEKHVMNNLVQEKA